MNTQKNDGGPAFPYCEQDGQGGYEQHKGMTLRDYFAGQALAAMPAEYMTGEPEQVIATTCYRQADAMLAARKEVTK